MTSQSDAPSESSIQPEIREISRSSGERLARWYFCLPTILFFPDGTCFADQIGNQSRESLAEDDPTVSIIIHQISRSGGRLAAINEAVKEAIDRDSTIAIPIPPHEEMQAREVFPQTNYTVIEALTAASSPEEPAGSWSGQPEDLPPRADSLMRCLRFVDDIVRASRLATERPQPRPLYPTINAPIICYQADSEIVTYENEEGQIVKARYPVGSWDGPTLVLPNHTNFLQDMTPFDLLQGAMEEKFWHRLDSIRSGDRSISWLERFIEAQEALNIRGETGQAVVLSCTAIEVLITATTTMLLWEENMPAKEAAKLFKDGATVSVVKNQLVRRLKGSWNNADGPFEVWQSLCFRLRHRIVHGGYEPTRPEAVTALGTVNELSKFIFDRIADRRNDYPRSALLTIGEAGLKKRELWSGKIRKFSQEIAPNEDLWQSSLVKYNDSVIHERLSNEQE